jgi:hypothetical protein
MKNHPNWRNVLLKAPIETPKGDDMSRINWTKLLEHEGDALLTWLREAEDGCTRAIRGIWLFIVTKIPELLRHFLTWLYEMFFYVCRVTVRVARFAVLFTLLLGIIFGPLVVYPGIVTGAWAVLAFVGSIYGAQRQIKKHNGAKGFQKEVGHARA